jgi:hypoxanthine phosphoribosyltransferase
MANPEKIKNSYQSIINTFEGLSSGTSSAKDLQKATEKAYMLFTGGYFPHKFPEGNFAAENIKRIAAYCNLLSKRNKIDIAGGEREVATESEALLSLRYAARISENFLINTFKGMDKTSFSNKVFNDITNLSLSYVDSIVDGVADEYIAVNESNEAKNRAVLLARQGIRVGDSYCKTGLSSGTDEELKKFSRTLALSDDKLVRSFEIVATTQKKISRKKELIAKINQELAIDTKKAVSPFIPDIIFPIAHGGTELGLRVANNYEDNGADTILVYPLMYSIKTRKQKYPWISNDSAFLGKKLEGLEFLVTEDWVTTGNTLRGILNKLEETFPLEVRVATIKRDPEKSKIPILDKYSFYIGSWSEYKGQKTDSISEMD